MSHAIGDTAAPRINGIAKQIFLTVVRLFFIGAVLSARNNSLCSQVYLIFSFSSGGDALRFSKCVTVCQWDTVNNLLRLGGILSGTTSVFS